MSISYPAYYIDWLHYSQTIHEERNHVIMKLVRLDETLLWSLFLFSNSKLFARVRNVNISVIETCQNYSVIYLLLCIYMYISIFYFKSTVGKKWKKPSMGFFKQRQNLKLVMNEFHIPVYITSIINIDLIIWNLFSGGKSFKFCFSWRWQWCTSIHQVFTKAGIRHKMNKSVCIQKSVK